MERPGRLLPIGRALRAAAFGAMAMWTTLHVARMSMDGDAAGVGSTARNATTTRRQQAVIVNNGPNGQANLTTTTTDEYSNARPSHENMSSNTTNTSTSLVGTSGRMDSRGIEELTPGTGDQLALTAAETKSIGNRTDPAEMEARNKDNDSVAKKNESTVQATSSPPPSSRTADKATGESKMAEGELGDSAADEQKVVINGTGPIVHDRNQSIIAQHIESEVALSARSPNPTDGKITIGISQERTSASTVTAECRLGGGFAPEQVALKNGVSLIVQADARIRSTGKAAQNNMLNPPRVPPPSSPPEEMMVSKEVTDESPVTDDAQVGDSAATEKIGIDARDSIGEVGEVRNKSIAAYGIQPSPSPRRPPPSPSHMHDTNPRHSADEGCRGPLKVDVYGGSITYGGPALNYSNAARYSNILETLVPCVQVRNHAIPATGPEYWLLCDIEPADIIVSEYRINGQNRRIMKEWYDLTRRRARHTVILELWSWLTPPSDKDSLSWQVFCDRLGAYVREDEIERKKTNMARNNHSQTVLSRSSYSALRLDQADRSNWQSQVQSLFDYHNDALIAPSCFETVYQQDASERKEQARCRKDYTSAMQHGTFPYHRRVASSLATHFKQRVLPKYFNHSTILGNGHGANRTAGMKTRLCIGSFGMRKRQQTTRTWDAIVKQNHGFTISNPFSSRRDKITLNSNIMNSTLRLVCPAPYKYMTVGYVAHSDVDETCAVRLNDRKAVRNHLNQQRAANIRVRRYFPVEQSPLRIVLTHVSTNASFELTDVVCQMESPSSVAIKAAMYVGRG